MLLRASLHIHTSEDKKESIKIAYSIYDLIDQAVNKNFQVLAFTGHEKFLCRPEYITYAQERGILLIPGIELSLKKNFGGRSHVVVLNCDEAVENITSLESLKKYRGVFCYDAIFF